jgi:hypothetical protein
VQDLPSLDQLLDGAGHVFDRHAEIDAVLIVEIDAIGPEPPERFLNDAPDALRPAIQSVRAVDLETELGGDRNLVADRREGASRRLSSGLGHAAALIGSAAPAAASPAAFRNLRRSTFTLQSLSPALRPWFGCVFICVDPLTAHDVFRESA